MVKKEGLKGKIFFGSLVLLVVILDQLSKYLIARFNPHYNLKILTLHLVQNTGAGFGILPGQTFWLGLVSALVAGIILFYYQKIPKHKFPQIFFALFLGGILGNLIDRLFRGVVVDFIDFSFWPAFNLADSFITISVLALIIYFWKK